MVQRYYFYQKKEQFVDDFLRKYACLLTFFLRNSLVYSHSGSIYVLGSLLLVLAYLIDDGDGGRCPILLDVHVVVLTALY